MAFVLIYALLLWRGHARAPSPSVLAYGGVLVVFCAFFFGNPLFEKGYDRERQTFRQLYAQQRAANPDLDAAQIFWDKDPNHLEALSAAPVFYLQLITSSLKGVPQTFKQGFLDTPLQLTTTMGRLSSFSDFRWLLVFFVILSFLLGGRKRLGRPFLTFFGCGFLSSICGLFFARIYARTILLIFLWGIPLLQYFPGNRKVEVLKRKSLQFTIGIIPLLILPFLNYPTPAYLPAKDLIHYINSNSKSRTERIMICPNHLTGFLDRNAYIRRKRCCTISDSDKPISLMILNIRSKNRTGPKCRKAGVSSLYQLAERSISHPWGDELIFR